MSPAPPALFCLGLCVIQVIQAQHGRLPKPSLQALPSSLTPLKKPVTLKCQGPPGVDLYRLEKLGSGEYEDQDFLFIPIMKQNHAGRYRCSYQNGSRWSPPSEQLELIATGAFTKPSLSAHPSSAVPPGGDVTLQCQSRYGFDQFALYKEGDAGPYQKPERWYGADFPFVTVTAAHSGTYRCYSFSSTSPYLWSAPSDPVVLMVTGTSETPSQILSEVSLSLTKLPEVTRRHFRPLNSFTHKVSTTETSKNVTVSREVSSPPFGFAHQHYTKGNLVRICLGAVILIFLGASGRGLAQSKETPATQNQSCAKATPTPPANPKIT
ncbi:LOW QUALITY PROTEIN: platelet glycoprotein VI [Nannospalax galili]|uniref:LOW QUALITY PROTEIN: platelet glycoprotein VI n=1 Tax=Nannospalax galili TaxID=1026970 RepID=UPI00111C162B|nr:LOW QUALITY PROTEIN: platelet glycoprotein VI [Nannospalax galili]